MNAEITASVYSIVVVRDIDWRTATDNRVVPYLYGHTSIVHAVEGGLRVGVILRTDVTVPYLVSDPGCATGPMTAKREAVRLAEYQCARLMSGAYAARAIGTRLSAEEALIEAL